MSDDELICFCLSVSRGEIIEAIKSGKSTLDELKSELMCCTGCGTCQGRVEKIIDECANSSENSKNEQSA